MGDAGSSARPVRSSTESSRRSPLEYSEIERAGHDLEKEEVGVDSVHLHLLSRRLFERKRSVHLHLLSRRLFNRNKLSCTCGWHDVGATVQGAAASLGRPMGEAGGAHEIEAPCSSPGGCWRDRMHETGRVV